MMYVRVPYTDPSGSAAEMEAQILKAYAMRCPGVRLGIYTVNMAPTRESGDWIWTMLDLAVGLCRQYGLKILLELAYGGDDDGCVANCWDSTDQMRPVPADFTDLAAFYVAVVERFKIEYEWSLSNGEVIFTLWNEPDRVAFGATTDGEITADHVDFFNEATIALKTAYPEMLLAAPSLSVFEPRTYEWEALKVGKYEDNFGADLHPSGDWPTTWTFTSTMGWTAPFPSEASVNSDSAPSAPSAHFSAS